MECEVGLSDLFGFAKPRQPRRKLMRVIDAGSFPDGKDAVHFECGHCGFDEGWTYQAESVSAAKRGRPCPKCNSIN